MIFSQWLEATFNFEDWQKAMLDLVADKPLEGEIKGKGSRSEVHFNFEGHTLILSPPTGKNPILDGKRLSVSSPKWALDTLFIAANRPDLKFSYPASRSYILDPPSYKTGKDIKW